MQKMIEKILNNYEKHFPHHRELNDMAHADLIDSKGELQPARGIALNSGYFLDKGTKRRPHYQRNFDEGLSNEEKDQLAGETLNLSELASMLYHPEFILDRSSDEHLSENRQTARNVLEHVIGNYKEMAHEAAIHELLGPLAESLFEEIYDDKKALNALLPMIMVQGTEHRPEDYRAMLMNHFLLPAIQGHHHDHWRKGIKDYLARGGNHARQE